MPRRHCCRIVPRNPQVLLSRIAKLVYQTITHHQLQLEWQINIIVRNVVASRFSSSYLLTGATIATLPLELDVLHVDVVAVACLPTHPGSLTWTSNRMRR